MSIIPSGTRNKILFYERILSRYFNFGCKLICIFQSPPLLLRFRLQNPFLVSSLKSCWQSETLIIETHHGKQKKKLFLLSVCHTPENWLMVGSELKEIEKLRAFPETEIFLWLMLIYLPRRRSIAWCLYWLSREHPEDRGSLH